MSENERFVDDGFEAIEDQSFTDNLTKKTYYVDYFDEVIELCNSLWKQTQRFEKHNKDLMEENERLKDNQKDIQLLFKIIGSFREDCFVNNDFSGVATLDQLISDLDDTMDFFKILDEEDLE